jgi:hypothetical protein
MSADFEVKSKQMTICYFDQHKIQGFRELTRLSESLVGICMDHGRCCEMQDGQSRMQTCWYQGISSVSNWATSFLLMLDSLMEILWRLTR